MTGRGAARKLDGSSFEAGHDASPDRAVTCDETWARVSRVLELVPITRVYDVGVVDYLDLPVWSAVAPLARDLTVHSGRGATPLGAKVSAVMEAIERVCAESIPSDRTCHSTYRELASTDGPVPVDPLLFDLPFDTAYSPMSPVMWANAYDLLGEAHMWVARDLVITPATEGVTRGVETNGLASGNTILEATVHAVLEVVERDAGALEAYYSANHDPDRERRLLRVFDVASMPDAAREWVGRMRDAGLMVAVQDITAPDLGIPTYHAVAADLDFPGADGEIMFFAGYGVGMNAEQALLGALTEATQSHSLVMLGARDTFEGLSERARTATMRRRADLIFGPAVAAWAPPAAPVSGDLHATLRWVLARLRASGLRHCLIADLSRPDLDIPVVRALVPGLAGVYGDSSRRPARRLLASIA